MCKPGGGLVKLGANQGWERYFPAYGWRSVAISVERGGGHSYGCDNYMYKTTEQSNIRLFKSKKLYHSQ